MWYIESNLWGHVIRRTMFGWTSNCSSAYIIIDGRRCNTRYTV